MIEVAAATGTGSAVDRSFAACLASILEVRLEDVPSPTTADPLVSWQQWLAGQGLGLVRPADPQRFKWAGHWIARLGTADGTRPAVVMFGVPSGIVWDPLGRGEAATAPVAEAFVITALDLRLARRAPAAMRSGVVRGLFVAPRAEAPMISLPTALALRGRGLRGDRYADAAGTFSVPGGKGNDLTLISAEALDALELPDGDPLPAEHARRNVLTQGIDLNALVGRRFLVGEVQCIGQRLCEPCAHLQRLARPGVLRGLVHRGGLRADLLSSGTIRVDDPIRPDAAAG